MNSFSPGGKVADNCREISTDNGVAVVPVTFFHFFKRKRHFLGLTSTG